MISNNKFYIKDLKNIVFIGKTSIFDDLILINKKNNLKSFIITSSDQAKHISKKIPFKIFNAVDNKFKNYIKAKVNLENTLFISLGSRIIFSSKEINNFFKNNLINVHPTMLPFNAGAGHFSWKILMGDKIDIQLVHLINEKIDSGPIIKSEKSIFPNSSKTPADYEKVFLVNFLSFYLDLIREIKKGKKFELKHQPDYIGSYIPKLNTIKNGLINWQLDPDELYRFICAFDDPYEGASTCLNTIPQKKVFLKDVYLHNGNTPTHSFMAGLISRIDRNWIEVCIKNNNVLLIKKIIDVKGKNIIKNLKVGDRFFTPAQYLENSLSFRAKYTSRGLK